MYIEVIAMQPEQPEDIVKVASTDKSREYWLNRPYISADLRSELSNADILIVPQEGFREHSGPVFPDGTETVLAFLKDNQPEGILTDICIEDADYRILDLRNDHLHLGRFLVENAVFPVVVGLLVAYVGRFWKSKPEDATVKTELITEDPDGSCTSYSYDGPAKDFERIMGGHMKLVKARQKGSPRSVVSREGDRTGNESE